MTEIQKQLISLGLTTPKRVKKIEAEKRLKNLIQTVARLSKKIQSGDASPRDFEKYSRLKRRLPRDLQFIY